MADNLWQINLWQINLWQIIYDIIVGDANIFKISFLEFLGSLSLPSELFLVENLTYLETLVTVLQLRYYSCGTIVTVLKLWYYNCGSIVAVP